MFRKLALLNIMADKRRSVITVVLAAVSTALLVFSSAWMEGSHEQMLKNAVEIYPGYIQITGPGFRATPSYDNLIFDSRALEQRLAAFAGIKSFTSRFESFVLFSAGEKAVGGMLAGIAPEKESAISRLRSSLKEGEYLNSADENQLYIGKELARRLRIKVGDQLAFVGNGADYSFAADIVTVKGIFQTGLFDFDAGTAFTARPWFDRVMAAEDISSHFIVLPRVPSQADVLAREIAAGIGSDYETLSWRRTMSGLVKAMKVDSIFGYITLAIIFIVIFFVIMIYTLLAVFGRIHEIGIMRAIGTTPGQIMALLLLEAIVLGLAGVLPGGLLGGALAWYFEIHPIVFGDFTEQFKQYGLPLSAMPTAFLPLMIVRDMAVMFFLLLLSTLYPIIKVNGYRPMAAINHI